jgi:cell division protein ZapB
MDMEVLDQLESQVMLLLDKYKRLKEEHARLQAQLTLLQEEKTALAEENGKLGMSLEKEGQLRSEARTRIDALLRKIEEHDSIE